MLVKLHAKKLSQEAESLKDSIVLQLIVLIPPATILYEPSVRSAPAAELGNTAEEGMKKEVEEGQIRGTSCQLVSAAAQSSSSSSSSSSAPVTAAPPNSDSSTADGVAPVLILVQPLSPVKPSVVYKWQVCHARAYD